MMILNSVGAVIARREYTNIDGGTVQILVGKPHIFPKGEGIEGYYYSPFQILGVKMDMVMHSSGIDEIEAIKSAMRMVGARLCNHPLAVAGKLRWEHGQTESDLGFGE
jgi:hypothetical protein